MKKEKFAEALGFGDYIKLLDSSEVVYVEGDVTWYVTKLKGGRWAAWDDAELAIDRVSYCKDKEEALDFQKAGVQASKFRGLCRNFVREIVKE